MQAGCVVRGQGGTCWTVLDSGEEGDATRGFDAQDCAEKVGLMSALIPSPQPATPVATARVAVKLAQLNADELEAIEVFVDKLIAGKLKHGPLDLDTDQRDWLDEIKQEMVDGAFYAVFAVIQRKRGLL